LDENGWQSGGPDVHGAVAGTSSQASPGSPRGVATLDEERDMQMKAELEEARRELRVRVQKFREELVEDMRPHEVSLLQRPTTMELEDPRLAHLRNLRRPHHKVVVGADEKEIKGMPDHKLCINDDLKRSLTKMRENLFQRRLNLAIYEKTTGDWALPQLRREVRKRNRKAVERGSRSVPTGHAVLPSPGGVHAEAPTLVAAGAQAVGNVAGGVGGGESAAAATALPIQKCPPPDEDQQSP